MKITKKLLAMVLVLTMTLGLGVTANAASDDKPILALGADLSTDQRAAVLGLLGVDESDLANYDVITRLTATVSSASPMRRSISIWTLTFHPALSAPTPYHPC